MNVNELEQKLDKALIDFSDDLGHRYDDYDNTSAVKSDISQVARQTYYAMNEFKNEIIKFLRSQ